MQGPHTSQRTVALAACLFALGARESVARADPTAACLAAYEKSQQLRQDGKLAASREQLVQCVDPACPSLVKKDCSQWLSELDASTPTVIVNARDAEGKDVAKVRVLVDGVVLMDLIDGKPHQIDPGVHVFRYEREGNEAIEESIVIQEREKNRVITAKLAPPAPTSSGTTMRTSDVAPHSPAVGYTLLGVGVVGATAFGVLAAMGQHDVDQMKDGPDRCAPDCPSGRIDTAKTKIIVANVSLGVGIIAAGVGTFILLKPRAGSTGLELGVRPVAGGGATSLGYRF